MRPFLISSIRMGLDTAFLMKLEDHLSTLPPPKPDQPRLASWMTAEEIAQWGKLAEKPPEIDEALLKWWCTKTPRCIRFAKYPHETKLCRLWGHVSVVPEHEGTELRPWNAEAPIQLDPIPLPPRTPEVFLSFSSLDFELAMKVRQSLADLRIRTLIYQAIIARDEPIIESVRNAMTNCQGVVVLLTRSSMASAWVQTEVKSALGFEKPAVALIDGTDSVLVDFLKNWDKQKSWEVRLDLFGLLLQRYAEHVEKCAVHRVGTYGRSVSDQLVTLASGSFYTGIAVYQGSGLQGWPIFQDAPMRQWLGLPPLIEEVSA
jgi:TIR domain